MKIKIVNKSGYVLPKYETENSAGLDIRVTAETPFKWLKAGQRLLVKTGLYLGLEKGYEAQIRPRSGMAIRDGITVLNSPGTIDADYRGEIKVILINHSAEDFLISGGDRICQMVIKKYERAEWDEVDELDETERGDNGFGSTGKN